MEKRKENNLSYEEWKFYKELGAGNMSINDMIAAKKIAKKICSRISTDEIKYLKKCIENACPNGTDQEYLALMKSTASEIMNNKNRLLNEISLIKNGFKFGVAGGVLYSIGEVVRWFVDDLGRFIGKHGNVTEVFNQNYIKIYFVDTIASKASTFGQNISIIGFDIAAIGFIILLFNIIKTKIDEQRKVF